MKKLIQLGLMIVIASSAILPIQADDNEQEKFEQFLMDEYIDTLENDYTTLHFGLLDYEKYGITKPEINFGSAKWEDYSNDEASLKETLKELESFNYEELSDTSKVDYDTFHYYLERMIALNKYPYFDFWFNPASGMQDNLLTNLTEFVFYRDEDIDDYLTLLKTTPSFIDDAMEITKKQAQEGYFITDSGLDTVLESIDRFLDEKENNQLVVVFNENIDAYQGISATQKEEYKKENENIVLNDIIPAYEKLRNELEDLRGARTFGNSVYDMPQGKEYFTELLKMKSSTDATPQELFDICDEVLEKEIKKLYKIAFSASDEDETISLNDPTEIIEFHRDNMEDFPNGPEVTYKATYLDPSVATESTVAYYMEPPIDFLTNNVIKINGDAVNDANELYSTLAHEGFPGHCYQITWYLDTNPSPLRTTLSNIAYTEGWAMYVEDYMFSKMPIENETTKEMNRLNTTIGYILNASADIAYNGLGYSIDDFAEYLTDLGLTADMAEDLYDYVCDMPGVITPYGLGLAQFLRLKDKAQNEMGDNFNIKDFHEVLLTNGDRPFALVEKDVKNYIETGRVHEDGYVDANDNLIDDLSLDDMSDNKLITAGAIFLITIIGMIIAFIAAHFAKKKDPFKS